MKRPVLWIALVTQLVLSIGYLVSVPVFEAPDESDHFRYAAYLSHRGELPLIPGTATNLGAAAGFDEEQLAHHPPLYYATLALAMKAAGHGDTTFSIRKNPHFNEDGHFARHLTWIHARDELWPVSNEVRMYWGLRFLSVLCGLATLLLTWRLGLLVFPNRPAIADLAVLLMVCLPMWSFMHGVLDNGNLATVVSHAVLLVICAALLHGGFRLNHGLGLGLLTGVALITKLTSLFLLPLLAFACGWSLWRCPGKRQQTWLSGVIALALIAGIAGWFFWHNLQLYGDPLGEAAHARNYAINAIPENLVWEWLTGDFLLLLGGSLLGNLGWMVLPMPAWLGWLALVVLAVGVFGLGTAWVQRAPLGQGEAPRVLLAFLVLAAALVFLFTARFNMKFGQPQGRYLFPALGPMALLLSLGLHSVAATWLRLPRKVWAGLALLLPILGLWVLVGWFRPVFDVGLTGEQSNEHHAVLAAGIATPPEEPKIQLLAPADGSCLDAAPLLRWQPVEPDAVYTVHGFTADGRILFATHEWIHLEIRGSEWQFPKEHWHLLPKNQEILWKVRALPHRGGEEVGDTPESGVSRFTRVGGD